MRNSSFLLVSAALLAQTARAQNSDFGVLAGVTWPVNEVVSDSGAYVRNSVRISEQLNYAFQTLQRSVDLYVEFPAVLSTRDLSVVNSGAGGASGVFDIFFTPGVRVKFSPESRVSVYGAFGVGVASFGGTRLITAITTVDVSRETAAALDFGGGVDFRLTRLLSFRVDLRDFVTRAGLGGTTGMHHGVLGLALAFHF